MPICNQSNKNEQIVDLWFIKGAKVGLYVLFYNHNVTTQVYKYN